MTGPFHINREGPLLGVGFGDPADNDAIVRAAHAQLARMAEAGVLDGGGPLGITGPAAPPVVVTIANQEGPR